MILQKQIALFPLAVANLTSASVANPASGIVIYGTGNTLAWKKPGGVSGQFALTSGNFASGDIPFVNANGLLTGSEFYYDSVNNRIGLNTASPADLFELKALDNQVRGIRFSGLNGWGGSIGAANAQMYFRSASQYVFRVVGAKLAMGDGGVGTANIELGGGLISYTGNSGGLSFDSSDNASLSDKLTVLGGSLSTDTTGSFGSGRFLFNVTKNDALSKAFSGLAITGTLNTGVSNTTTTLNVLEVNTVNTSVVGVTVNLLNLNYGSSPKFTVDSTGNVTASGNVSAATYNSYFPARAASASFLNSIISSDTRNIDSLPSDRPAGLYADFKTSSVIGTPEGTYSGLLTFRSYASGEDFTGGPAIQLAYGSLGSLFTRASSSASAWGSWRQLVVSGMTNAVGLGTSTPGAKLQIAAGGLAVTTASTAAPDPGAGNVSIDGTLKLAALGGTTAAATIPFIETGLLKTDTTFTWDVTNKRLSVPTIICSGYIRQTGAIDTASSGGLSFKTGKFTALPSSATDAFVGILDSAVISGASAGDLAFMPRSNSNNAIRFLTGNGTPAERLTINFLGNVGIATSTPGSKLQVTGGFVLSSLSAAQPDPGAGNSTVSGSLHAFTSIGISQHTVLGVTATATTGGTLSAGTYFYKIVAFDGASGSTVASAEVSAVVDGTSTTAVLLNWTAVVGATSYRVYKGTATNAQSSYYSPTTNTYTDTGLTGTTGTVSTATFSTLKTINLSFSGNSWFNTAGKLGVGTHTPGAELQVTGGLSVSNSTAATGDPGGGNGYFSGLVGIGLINVSSHKLHIASTNNQLRLAASSTIYTSFSSFTSGTDSYFDLDPITADTTSVAFLRLFRSTNTTASAGIIVCKGDNTTSANTYISANSSSYLNALTGSIGIGTTTPGAKLQVAGSLSVTSSTAASTDPGAGNASISGNLTVSGNLSLPTTSVSTGAINVNGAPFIHSYGVYNTFVGAAAGNRSLTGANNAGFATATLASLTTGIQNTSGGVSSCAFTTTGNANTAFGYASLYINTTGGNNAAFGASAGRANTTGTNLTFVGANAGYTGTTDGLTNSSAFGYNAQVTASNCLILGNNVNVGIGVTAPGTRLQVANGGLAVTIATTTSSNPGAGNAFVEGTLTAAILRADSFEPTYREVTTSTTITVVSTDFTILVNKSVPAATSVILPGAGTNVNRRFEIIDAKGDAATNNITITVAGGEYINGTTSYVMTSNREVVTVCWLGNSIGYVII